MPGPPPKRHSLRDKEGRTTVKASVDVEVIPAHVTGAAVPAPPPGLPPEIAAEWDALWSSAIATTVATTDLPALRRLYKWRGTQHELRQLAGDEGLMGEGHGGQDVLHPALKAAKDLEPAICALEDRFGLSLRARQSLGIRMGALADVAERHPDLLSSPSPQAGPRARVDPRVIDTPPGPGKGNRPDA